MFYSICSVVNVCLLVFILQHISSAQEPNLSRERSTQSTVAFLYFPGFYSPFIAGEGIRLFNVFGKCLRPSHNLLPRNDIVSKP